MPSLDAFVWIAIGSISALAAVACLRIIATEIDNGAGRERLVAEAQRVQARQIARLREIRRTHRSQAGRPDAVEGAEAVIEAQTALPSPSAAA